MNDGGITMSKPYVITISRTFGSGGKTIGLDLAEELGIPCYGDQILKMASEASGISEQLFAQADQKLRGSFLRRIASFPDIERAAKPSDKDFTSDDNLFRIQVQIVRQLAETQSCIILGKCANVALYDYDNVLSVFVDADRKSCIKNVMDRMYCSEAEAEKLIKKTDKYRADYYTYYSSGKTWKDPREFDLVLNTGRLGFDGAAQVIKDTLRIKGLID